MATPIPVTIVGGFLGAGKTTLLNHVLGQARGRRLAVLVNDFGAINVDADLIVAHDGSTMSLSNGCICCSIGDSLSDALHDVARRPEPPDHVVVEASGVADPARIREIAELDRAFMPQGVFIVVDADRIRTTASDPYVADTVHAQLASADVVVLNKTDLRRPDDILALEAWLRQRAPQAPILRTARGEIPLDVLLGPTGGFGRRDRRRFVCEAPGAAGFRTTTIVLPRAFSDAALRCLLDSLPEPVLRLKGFVATDALARPQLVQAVGRRWSLADAPDGTHGRGLVVIGTPDLDLAAFRQRVMSALLSGENTPGLAEFAGT